jgi:TP901-1 family phage major tail protein
MATTGVLNGSDMIFYLDGTAFGSSTSHSINVTMATGDVTVKDNAGWRSKLEGMREWSGSAEGFVAWDDDFHAGEIFAYITSRTAITLIFSTDVTGDYYFTGSCYITGFDVTAPMEENTTMSLTFEGAGELTCAAQST